MQASDGDDLSLLTEAALAAGELVMGYFRHRPAAWEKADDAGPVSEADLAVNLLLERRLRKARPDYGWLSEESTDDLSRLSAERVFIIDPIDGTRAFLNEDSGFGHALAVAEAGRVIAGVVHMPALGLTYAACETGPALLNGQPIGPSQAAQIEGSSVLTSRLSDDPRHWKGAVPRYDRQFRPSLAWRMCLVAEGRFDATISLRDAFEWDTAAGCLIAERAGALCSDRTGAGLRYNRPEFRSDGLVVAPPALHAAYLARLA